MEKFNTIRIQFQSNSNLEYQTQVLYDAFNIPSLSGFYYGLISLVYWPVYIHSRHKMRVILAAQFGQQPQQSFPPEGYPPKTHTLAVPFAHKSMDTFSWGKRDISTGRKVLIMVC